MSHHTQWVINESSHAMSHLWPTSRYSWFHWGELLLELIVFLLDHLTHGERDDPRDAPVTPLQLGVVETTESIHTTNLSAAPYCFLYKLSLFNPFPHEQVNLWTSCQYKFAILVHFLYFVYDAKRSAGEQLAGWSFCILNKYRKWTKMANLFDFVHQNASKCNSAKTLFVS